MCIFLPEEGVFPVLLLDSGGRCTDTTLAVTTGGDAAAVTECNICRRSRWIITP